MSTNGQTEAKHSLCGSNPACSSHFWSRVNYVEQLFYLIQQSPERIIRSIRWIPARARGSGRTMPRFRHCALHGLGLLGSTIRATRQQSAEEDFRHDGAVLGILDDVCNGAHRRCPIQPCQPFAAATLHWPASLQSRRRSRRASPQSLKVLSANFRQSNRESSARSLLVRHNKVCLVNIRVSDSPSRLAVPRELIASPQRHESLIHAPPG